MQLYEELVARGLIAQVTNEDEIREMINAGKATFYIGFDCTADSLTAGHFVALTFMKRLQAAGNKPIALIGGGTTMIGDPSGRTDMRKMLTKEDIDHNAQCFKRQMERFIEFGEGKAQMVNNADWLLNLNYVELLREVGACFSVNNMFIHLYIDALASAGVQAGLPRTLAQDIACQTVLGSAKLTQESGEHPVALMDQVCSPGGTTIEGVHTLKRLGFETAVQQAIRAIIEKDRRLAE